MMWIKKDPREHPLLKSEPALVGSGNEALNGENIDLPRIIEMLFESTSGLEVAELPSFATKNEIRFGILVAGVKDRLN